MKPRRSWTKGEIDIIRANINTIPYSSIASMLPGRNVDDVKTRASLEGIERTGKRFPRRTLNEEFFSQPDLLSSYWAGFIAADGCVVTVPRTELRIGIHVKDMGHLARFRYDVGFDGALTIGQKNICRLTVCAAHRWVQDLKENFNIGPRKTLTLEGPNLTGDTALAYSVGYIDGDGCWATADKNKNLRIIVVGTRPLLMWLVKIWNDAGADIGDPAIVFRKVWRLTITCAKADRIASILGKIDVPRLERKWRVARHERIGQDRRFKETHD
jgi:hypothetical protein